MTEQHPDKTNVNLNLDFMSDLPYASLVSVMLHQLVKYMAELQTTDVTRLNLAAQRSVRLLRSRHLDERNYSPK